MSSLVGIVAPDLAEAGIRKLVAAQLQRVSMPAAAAEAHVFCGDGFGMGHRDLGHFANYRSTSASTSAGTSASTSAGTSAGTSAAEPGPAFDAGLVALLDGEVLNIDDLARRYLPDHATHPRSPAATCAELVALRGAEIAVEFNGLFTLALYHAGRRELTLINDRLGFRSLYIARRGSRFLFGSEIKALCAADGETRQLDRVGLAEQFIYGNPVMEKTWIAGYERLTPGSILRVTEAGVEHRTYWKYAYDEAAPVLDQGSYFTVYATRLARAVERVMHGSGRKGLFLSGGYDSRAIAAAIHASHRPLPAFTFGDADSRDVRFGRLLAERLGLEHHVFHDQPQQAYLYDYCRAINWRSEGMLSFGHVTSMRHHDTFCRHFDIVLTGFLAEFNGSHTWPALLLARTRDAATEAIYQRFVGARLGFAADIFTPAFHAEAVAAVRERFARSIETVDNDHPHNLADAWNMAHVQPRTTFLSPIVDRHRFEIRAPHMDAELLDFLLTIPPWARIEQRVYKKMIAYAYPEIRDVPCTNSAEPIDPNFAREYAKMVARYVARKVSAPVLNRLPGRRDLGRELSDRNQQFRDEPALVDGILKPLLADGIFPSEVFNHEAIDRIVTQHYQHRGAHWEAISLLLSWGLGASYFLYGDQQRDPGIGVSGSPPG